MSEVQLTEYKQRLVSDEIVTIIGLGYVGLPLALLTNRSGYSANGLDSSLQRVTLINDGIPPFYDKEIAKYLPGTGLKATTDELILKKSTVVVVCVPTPIQKLKPDLTALEDACRAVGSNISPGTLVIIESTVNPGVCDEVVIPLIEKGSGMKLGTDFFLAHCPERINPGDTKWSVANIPRVLGANDQESLSRALDFYQTILAAAIHPMGNIAEAEAVKLVENSFRDVNVAFINELAMFFAQLNVDIIKVIEGAATKPFAFLPHYPGIGVGGHCIPVDPLYLIESADKKGFDHKLLKIARQTNDGMPAYGVSVLRSALLEKNMPLKGATVGVLGISYKENIGDIRESPTFEVIKELLDHGAQVIAHDPHVDYTHSLKQFTDLEKIFDAVDAIIICTGHQEYLGITESSLSSSKIKAVIDGRNCLNKDEFSGQSIIYRGIGR